MYKSVSDKIFSFSICQKFHRDKYNRDHIKELGARFRRVWIKILFSLKSMI